MAAGAFALLAAAEARAASIDIGSVSGMPGDEVSVAVSLRTMGAAVLGTQNRIDFDLATPVAATPRGTPDCAANPVLDKGATAFRYLPLGCGPAVDCQAVRAFVLSFDNLDPIPDNSVLYTCHIAIAADAAAGAHALRNSEAGASALDGQSVPATGSDGSVEVVLAPVASIDIGATSAPAGTGTTVAVTVKLLTDPPALVTGVQNDIGFDPLTPIAAAPDGHPACTVDPDIAKEATSFAFLPMGCTPGVDCTAARAVVLSNINTRPLTDGATLYSCEVMIAAAAPLGTYPLVNAMPLASGPRGEILPALASNGSIEVTEPPAPSCVGDCDGDHVVAINELLLGVNIIIDGAPLMMCSGLDVNHSGTVSIDELVQAVNNALSGCPEDRSGLVDEQPR